MKEQERMAKIPSIEKTDDFIYRFEVKKSSRGVSDDPHLLVFEGGGRTRKRIPFNGCNDFARQAVC